MWSESYSSKNKHIEEFKIIYYALKKKKEIVQYKPLPIFGNNFARN